MAKRFHMELSGDAKERLMRMRDRAQLKTLTYVVQDALEVYEYLFEEYMDHNAEFFVRRKGSDIEKVLLFRFSKKLIETPQDPKSTPTRSPSGTPEGQGSGEL